MNDTIVSFSTANISFSHYPLPNISHPSEHVTVDAHVDNVNPHTHTDAR